MTLPAEITWGALKFVNPEAAPPAEGYLVHAMAGTGFGNPQPLIDTVKSMLTDGSLAVLEGWDNREVQVHLRISAPRATAGTALPEGEAVLFAQVQAEVKAPLVYVPPAEDSPTCVFDVVVARLDRDTSDSWDIEEQAGRAYRYYLLTLTCLPFVRGEQTVVVPALPVPPNPGGAAVFVNLDTCDSTTNWAASYVGGSGFALTPVAVNSGAVRAKAVVSGGSATEYPGITETRTGALSMSGNPYLAIDVRTSHPSVYVVPTITVDGVVKTPIAVDPIGGGLTRIYVASGNFTTVAVSALRVTGGPFDGSDRWLEVANVARTDTIGDKVNSTLRQQSRTATVSGSAPTTAEVRFFDATPSTLGTEILVHTSRNTAWRPPLRRWCVTATTADATRVSGGRNTLASPMTMRIPANQFTEGVYSLMALMLVSTAGTLTWSAKMVSSTGTATVGSTVVTTGTVAVPTTGGVYKTLNLAAIPLPVLKVEADQMVELTLTGTANMTVDEGWLFGLHDGALTWLQDVDSLTWIEIRSPELGAARPSVYGGTGAKGANSVCIDWKCQSFGAHRFEPGLMQIFTVSSASLVGQSEIEFYERGHSHMAAA
ncbi:hypothetical protein [Nocardioides sp. SLBN-35]|uniref:hypothetical protein n=1 Tax=Nocardioides sp. SLBN-35 TaxID=2768445 RepID=UPI001166B5A4|nr:hypothetical protein [Nocardioides sp. SLBN-35]TQK73358.1 hypothetical protein FBY23_5190 [Nocardioides sp. SLBN-35]